jgi:hypothetical protein
MSEVLLTTKGLLDENLQNMYVSFASQRIQNVRGLEEDCHVGAQHDSK